MRHIAFFRGSRGKQLFSPCFISFAQLRRVLQNPQQITVRIKAILLRRFNQTVDHGAGRRPQMRCSAAGLRSQRPPFRRAQRPPGDGSRQPHSHPSGCGFGSNENGEVLRCPFQNGVGRNLVIQDHCTPALWITLRADERAELHLATFL